MQGLRIAACSSSPRERQLLDSLEPLRIPRRLPAPVRHDTDDDEHDEKDPFEQREERGEEARSRDAPSRRRFLQTVDRQFLERALHQDERVDVLIRPRAGGTRLHSERRQRAKTRAENEKTVRTVRGRDRDDVVCICLVLVKLVCSKVTKYAAECATDR